MTINNQCEKRLLPLCESSLENKCLYACLCLRHMQANTALCMILYVCLSITHSFCLSVHIIQIVCSLAFYLFVNYFHIDELSLFWRLTMAGLSFFHSLALSLCFRPFHFNNLIFVELNKSCLSFQISCGPKAQHKSLCRVVELP